MILMFFCKLVPRTHFDDEYNELYIKEPKILLTTCRHASTRLINFMKVILKGIRFSQSIITFLKRK